MSDLSVKLWNIEMAHPVMPAAGPPVMDADALAACGEGGASVLVVKTISTKAAVIPHPNMADFKTYFLNTELWSELSPEYWIEHELPRVRAMGKPVIISLGYTRAEIANLAPRVAKFADALELSTHYISDDLNPFMDTIKAAKDGSGLPVLPKLSPFRNIEKYAEAAQKAGADGIVAVNSLGPALGVDIENGGRLWMGGKGYGWVSGPALKPIALRAVYDIARTVDLPILGVGGINRGTDVVEYLMAGASAVQVCTAAINRGPQVYGKIAAELNNWLDSHGYASVNDIRGLALKQGAPLMEKPPRLLPEKCTGCNLCVTSCVYDALFLENKKIDIHAENCTQCGVCISRCPTGAVLVP
jgi:dihydroorotate dehydrogenase (NAD+) catalytic subunit